MIKKENVDINRKDIRGNTSFFHSLNNENDIWEEILKEREDFEFRIINNRGQSYIDVAYFRNNNEALKKLKVLIHSVEKEFSKQSGEFNKKTIPNKYKKEYKVLNNEGIKKINAVGNKKVKIM